MLKKERFKKEKERGLKETNFNYTRDHLHDHVTQAIIFQPKGGLNTFMKCQRKVNEKDEKEERVLRGIN